MPRRDWVWLCGPSNGGSNYDTHEVFVDAKPKLKLKWSTLWDEYEWRQGKFEHTCDQELCSRDLKKLGIQLKVGEVAKLHLRLERL